MGVELRQSLMEITNN